MNGKIIQEKENKIQSMIEQEEYLLDFTGIEEYINYDNIKNPFNFRSWWNTIISASDAPYNIKVRIFESALKFLPGSYKIWYYYLKEARNYVLQWSVDDVRYEVINDLHERALIYMNKMPIIWNDYCEFLIEQRLITKTRKVFDRALMSLPATQHDKVWANYIQWVESLPVLQTTISIYKRYLRFNPDAREDFISYLISNEMYEESVINIINLLDDDLFHSQLKKTKFDYWLLLCDLISKYPYHVNNIDCENVIRHGLNKYTDEVGRLWVALCNFYIKQGLFEKSRDIFEEALSMVSTARDFSIVFNSYLKFEEELVTSMIKLKDDDFEENSGETGIENLINFSFDQLGISKQEGYNLNQNYNKEESLKLGSNTNNELNLKIFKITNLIERRPFLLSDALLRQNPNNVKEWVKRVKICRDDRDLIIETYEKAIYTVDPLRAFGKYDSLWIGYAKFYESLDELDMANKIFYKATQSIFKNNDQRLNIWCEWAEMHLRCGNYYDAYEIVKSACTNKGGVNSDKRTTNTTHSFRLWSLYVDLEEHLGTLANVKNIYQRMIDIKIANSQTIFNYCNYLEKQMYYEETFRVYEQATNYFTWPQAYDIWLVYLTKFVERYKGQKIERARDLFDQVLSVCPKDKIKIFYYMYAELEENYGLLNHSIRILDKGCNDVLKDEKTEVYSVLINKTSNFFGITKTRTIFTRALEVLDSERILDIGLKFAAIEKKLGEIDRARSIYIHLSQFSDPAKQENLEEFWKIWEDFELSHGNEDTFSEMLRMKRSVSSRFSLNASLFIVENKVPI